MNQDDDVYKKKIFVYAYPDHKDTLSLLGSATSVGLLFKLRKFLGSVIAMCVSERAGASDGACGHLFWPDRGRQSPELSAWARRTCPSELTGDACDVYVRGVIHGVVSGMWETLLFAAAATLVVGSFHGLVFCTASTVRKVSAWLAATVTVACAI